MFLTNFLKSKDYFRPQQYEKNVILTNFPLDARRTLREFVLLSAVFYLTTYLNEDAII